jgi:hypothetical protein
MSDTAKVVITITRQFFDSNTGFENVGMVFECTTMKLRKMVSTKSREILGLSMMAAVICTHTGVVVLRKRGAF